MLHSMTGFARETAEAEIGALTWEIRAVNHRYLDVQFRLPDQMRAHEQAFRQAVGGSLNRGKVECSLNFRRQLDRQAHGDHPAATADLHGARRDQAAVGGREQVGDGLHEALGLRARDGGNVSHRRHRLDLDRS